MFLTFFQMEQSQSFSYHRLYKKPEAAWWLFLKTKPMNVTICREEPDQNFMIDKIDVVDQEHMKEVIDELASHLREYCIYSIDISCVDGNKVTLKI